MPPLRILLVRPPGRFMSAVFPDGPMVGVPRSLLFLEAAVRHDPRMHVEILDALAHPGPAPFAGPERPALFGMPPDEVARRAVAGRADVVAISTMANYFRRETLEIAAAVRERLPNAFLLLGGPDPTVDADAYLAEAPIDAVCLGEGEATFAELMGRLAQRLPFADVAGLALVSDLGRVRRTGPRALRTELDAPALDFGRVDLPHYFALAAQGFRSRPTFLPQAQPLRAVDMVTSRGCPYQCSFCVIHATMGRKFRTVSIGAVLAQLRVLVEEHSVQHVHFEDDVINLDHRRFVALLRALVDAQLPLTWDTPNGVRADLLDAETVALCRESGCVYLIFGVESGNQRVLDEVVDKDLQLDAVVNAARLCHEAELDALAFYIVGMPGELRAEAEQTVAFAFDLFERFGVTPLLQVWRPYVQTELHERAHAAGMLHPADPAALHAQTKIPFTQFRDRTLTGGEIDADWLTATFDAYGRRLVQGQLSRWRRAGLRVPLDTGSDRAAIERFLQAQAPYLHAVRRAQN